MSIPQPQNNLPDFGSAVIAIRIILVAQGLAVILALSRNAGLNEVAWQDFLRLTSFVQFIAVGSIVALKLFAKPLQRMPLMTGAIVAFVVLLLVAFGTIEVIIFIMAKMNLISQRWPEWHLSLVVRTLVISALIIIFGLRYAIVHHRAQTEMEEKQSDRLQALQSRIRPHFLFNSMNSIASLIRTDPEQAEKALEDLADVFRVLLADARKMVPISVEGELARQYLDIEKLRLGDRLKVKWTASNVPRSAQLPSLTLQPLLENAVYHGIEPSFSGGTVSIELWSETDTLNIMISNPIPELGQKNLRKGNKIALNNVRARLESHYGGQAIMQSFEKLGNYHVKLRVPIVRG